MKRMRFPRWLILTLTIGGLPACGSLFQLKAAPPIQYLLSAAPAVTASPVDSPVAADLAVLRPRVSAGLDMDRIAALYPDRHLDYFADVRWSGPLDEVLQELAVREFRASGGLRNVSVDASVFTSAYWLEIDVTDFQAVYSSPGGAPTAHVHMLVRLGNSADRTILARFEADAKSPAADNRMGAIVEAYDRAANIAFTQIVTDVTQALRVR